MDHTRDAQRPESCDGGLCGSGRRIHEPYGAQVAITEAHDHCRTTLFAQALDCLRRLIRERREAIPTEHFGLADEHRLAVDPGLYAAARQTGHIRCCGDRLLVEKLLTIPRNGFSERMIAAPLDGYGHRHAFVVIANRRPPDGGEARPNRKRVGWGT